MKTQRFLTLSGPVLVFALLASAPVFAARLSGSVQTGSGDPIAATIVVLYDSQGATLESHSTDDDGTFSIDIGTGAVAVAAKAPNYASHEIDLSGGVPSTARFTLYSLRFYEGTLTDSDDRNVAGASVRVRNLDVDRKIHVDSHSTDVTDGSGGFVVAAPDGGSNRFVVDIHADGWVPQSSGVLGTGSVGSTGADDGPTGSVLVALESQGASMSGSVETPAGSGSSGITVLVAVKTTAASTGAGGLFTGGPGASSGNKPWGDIY